MRNRRSTAQAPVESAAARSAAARASLRAASLRAASLRVGVESPPSFLGTMAVRAGSNPRSRSFPAQRLSKPPHSATLPPSPSSRGLYPFARAGRRVDAWGEFPRDVSARASSPLLPKHHGAQVHAPRPRDDPSRTSRSCASWRGRSSWIPRMPTMRCSTRGSRRRAPAARGGDSARVARGGRAQLRARRLPARATPRRAGADRSARRRCLGSTSSSSAKRNANESSGSCSPSPSRTAPPSCGATSMGWAPRRSPSAWGFRRRRCAIDFTAGSSSCERGSRRSMAIAWLASPPSKLLARPAAIPTIPIPLATLGFAVKKTLAAVAAALVLAAAIWTLIPNETPGGARELAALPVQAAGTRADRELARAEAPRDDAGATRDRVALESQPSGIAPRFLSGFRGRLVSPDGDAGRESRRHADRLRSAARGRRRARLVFGRHVPGAAQPLYRARRRGGALRDPWDSPGRAPCAPRRRRHPKPTIGHAHGVAGPGEVLDLGDLRLVKKGKATGKVVDAAGIPSRGRGCGRSASP